MHYHINILELLEIAWAFEGFLYNLIKQYTRIFSDNTTAVTDVNKQGGIKSLGCNKQHNGYGYSTFITIIIFQLPTYLENIILTDLDSRQFHEIPRMILEPRIFDCLIDKLGRSEIDMFESKLNAN